VSIKWCKETLRSPLNGRRMLLRSNGKVSLRVSPYF
jgi:hypothetical protein